MKTAFNLLCMIVATLFVSCSDKEEVIIGNDSSPVPITIQVIDNDGRNLLDSDIEGNIRGNEIKAVWNGKSYPVEDKATNQKASGFFFNVYGELKCSFFMNKPSIKDEFAIDWGNGRKDYIRVETDRTASFTYYLNGIEVKEEQEQLIVIRMN